MAYDANAALQDILAGRAQPIDAGTAPVPGNPTVRQPSVQQADPDQINAIIKLFQAAGMDGANYNPPGVGHRDESISPAPTKPVDAPVDRVNADTSNTGIRAVRQADGTTLLTNLTDSGSIINKDASVTPSTQDQRGMATNVQGLINVLQNTTDPDKARGIMAQLNQSMAQEQARMYTEAQTFAQNKLQVPLLEQQLASNTALDHQALDYVPGAGDSPITARIRTALEDARGKADAEAKRYLQGNVSFNGLAAAEKTAIAEGQRISKMADAQTNMEFNKALSLENRQTIRDEALQQQADGLTTDQKDRIRILAPNLAQEPDTKLVLNLQQHKAKDDGYLQAIEAPEEALPRLAAVGNSYATAILTAKEQAAGQPPELTAARLAMLKSISSNDKDLKQGIALANPGVGVTERDKQFASLQALVAPGISTKESKAQYDSMRMGYAQVVLAQRVADQFKNDVSQWASPDQGIQQALLDTQNKVNKKDMASVLTTYLGESTGPARQVLINNFINNATTAAQRTTKSQLGTVDPKLVRQSIEGIETRSLLQRVFGDMSVEGMFAGEARASDMKLKARLGGS